MPAGCGRLTCLQKGTSLNSPPMVAVTQPSAGMLDDELFEMDDADDAKGAQPPPAL
jgi:hypothetical protein